MVHYPLNLSWLIMILRKLYTKYLLHIPRVVQKCKISVPEHNNYNLCHSLSPWNTHRQLNLLCLLMFIVAWKQFILFLSNQLQDSCFIDIHYVVVIPIFSFLYWKNISETMARLDNDLSSFCCRHKDKV